MEMLALKQNKYFLFLTYIILATSTINLSGQQFNANITIWTEKKIFLTQEPIWVFIKIENMNENGPKINEWKLYGSLKVLNSNGIEYEENDLYSFGNIPRMKPGEIIEGKCNIAYLYGKSGDNPQYTIEEFLAPDEYQIQCVWKELYYDPIYSNTIKVIVEDPVGDELRVLELYREGLKLIKEKNWSSAERKLEEIVDIYPQSVYAPKILSKIVLIHRWGKSNIEKSLSTCKRLLEKYPGKGYNDAAIREVQRCYEKKNDTIGARMYLESIAQKTQSTELKKMINKHHERIIAK